MNNNDNSNNNNNDNDDNIASLIFANNFFLHNA